MYMGGGGGEKEQLSTRKVFCHEISKAYKHLHVGVLQFPSEELIENLFTFFGVVPGFFMMGSRPVFVLRKELFLYVFFFINYVFFSINN